MSIVVELELVGAAAGVVVKLVPQLVKALRKKHPELAQALDDAERQNVPIAPSKEYAPVVVEAQVISEPLGRYQTEAEVMLTALVSINSRGRQVIESIKGRLRRTKNIRLVAGVIAALISSGLFAVLLTGPEHAKLLTGIGVGLNLIAALALLYASHLETSDYGGRRSIADHFESIASLCARAHQTEQALRLRIASGKATDAEIRALLKQGSGICAELDKVLVFV